MPDYKVVHGTKVQNISGDPPAPFTGQVWYNATTKVAKYFFINPGAWATGGDLTVVKNNLAGAGTQTAGLAFGGTPTPGVSAQTEKYNGTSWTEVNDLNTARYQLAGGGTQTAALAFGGGATPTVAITETWN